jgi:large subunit ribosomal protein L24|uniref:Large ribosomal subunit protein uL24c n=1 Tax=Cyanidioschyzon merolae (strain NIES-3377 / 10D) TaxID=280699 RepID=RK24_CYAM1|nr:ribosomal protein L24 [Cyanidioschyzon merolae strain 10D]Q85FV2.1 RecName: Full=Large ribosomal subunit protein uL24c; AltName: Full=50S ribosomal protein L24, chloroplastic [Cyanidioschyzon merolae strain 10D]BAC76242.1 50S ribosomal protein L24 [Cyanidioschyzon merolae strain 10D]
MKNTIKKGNQVLVLSGNSKGQIGEVLVIDRKRKQLVVKGINQKTKHMKPKRQGEVGQIIRREYPIHMSQVRLWNG